MLYSRYSFRDGSGNLEHGVYSYLLKHIIALWGAVLSVPLDPIIKNSPHLQTAINISW